MQNLIDKYAHLLVNYCLGVQKDQKVYIQSSYLAEPLLNAVVRETYLAGGHPVLNVEIYNTENPLLKYGEEHQLLWQNPIRRLMFEQFDAYLNIRAPFERGDDDHEPADVAKYQLAQKASLELGKIYSQRTGNGSMRRCLCQFPTQAGADDARMSLEEYSTFVFNACKLNEADPVAAWLKVREVQQVYVDRLNKADMLHYRGPHIDIRFSVKGRLWMNSDGRANMPSGEVFSAPIEDSMQGKVYFSYPTIYMGKDVAGVELEVKDGEVISWKAEKGQAVLDKVFSVPGARKWGEVAVGCNYDIQRITRNILFDEKIGGSIHMAVGQSYSQCGGKNESAVHWDLITDMRDGGEIVADGEVIYRNGAFLL